MKNKKLFANDDEDTFSVSEARPSSKKMVELAKNEESNSSIDNNNNL